MSETESPQGQRPGELDLPNSPLWMGAGIFWFCAAIGAMMPLLPVYLKEQGVPASGFAFITALQQITSLCIGQLIGYIADTRLRRTVLMMVMAAGGAVCAALFPFIPPHFALLSGGMVAISFFVGQRTSLYNSLVLDSHRGEELYSRIRGFGSVGFVIVAPIVGWLADHYGTVIMWPLVAVFELAFLFTMLKLTDVPASMRGGKAKGRLSFAKAQRVLLSNRVLLWFLIYTFIVQSVHLPGHFFQLILLKEMGATSLFVTMAVAWAAVCEIAVFYHGPRIIARFDMMHLLAIVPAALMLRFLIIFLFSGYPWMIFASNTLHMFTYGLAYLCSVIFVNREVPRELKSSGQALLNMVFAVIAALVGNLATAGILRWLNSAYGLDDRQALVVWFGMSVCWVMLAFLAMIPMRRGYRARPGKTIATQ